MGGSGLRCTSLALYITQGHPIMTMGLDTLPYQTFVASETTCKGQILWTKRRSLQSGYFIDLKNL